MNAPTPDHTHADIAGTSCTSGDQSGHAVAATVPGRPGHGGHPLPGGVADPASYGGHLRPNGQPAHAGQLAAPAMPAGGSASVATPIDGGRVTDLAASSTHLAGRSDRLSTVGPVADPDAAPGMKPIAVNSPRRLSTAGLVLRVVGRLLLVMVLAGSVLVLAVGLGRWMLLAGLAPAVPDPPAPVPVWGGVRGVMVLAQDQSGGVSLEQFLANLRTWIFRILGTVTATVLAIGGIRLAAANGEPEQVAKAKETIKSGAWGFVFTMLAPAFVTILQQLVGGSR